MDREKMSVEAFIDQINELIIPRPLMKEDDEVGDQEKKKKKKKKKSGKTGSKTKIPPLGDCI